MHNNLVVRFEQTPMTIRSDIDTALRTSSCDSIERAVCRLMKCDPKTIMKRAIPLSISSIARERHLGVWLMGELGYPRRPFLRTRFALLKTSFLHDRRISVQKRAALSLGQLRYRPADDVLANAARRATRNIKQSIAEALCARPTRSAIACLKSLSTDVDPHVREWAIFGIALELSRLPYRKRFTTSFINTFRRSLNDPSVQVRYEAIWGLCMAGDSEGIHALVNEVAKSGVHDRLIDALTELGGIVARGSETEGWGRQRGHS